MLTVAGAATVAGGGLHTAAVTAAGTPRSAARHQRSTGTRGCSEARIWWCLQPAPFCTQLPAAQESAPRRHESAQRRHESAPA